MATAQVLFRVACPSCDAQIPIRDGGLVGKKVECPKCKYRFIVEEPEGYEAADEAPKAKKGAKKSKKGSNPTLMIGIGVGVVAIGVLAAVAYVMFFKDDKKPTQPSTSNVASNQSNSQAATTETPPPNTDNTNSGNQEKSAETPVTTKATTPAATVTPLEPGGTSGEISNLLPNDADVVTNINMRELRYSKLGEQLFESKIGLKLDTFKQRLGIGIDEMQRLVRAENLEQKWTFNVLRTFKPINVSEMVSKMGLVKAKAPVGRWEYYTIPPHDLMDNLTDALKGPGEGGDAVRRNGESGMALAMLDQTTVVIATTDQVVDFLRRDAKQRLLVQPTKRGDNDQQPGGSGPGPNRGGRNMAAPLLLQVPAPAGGGEDPTLTDNPNYLSVDAHLKFMFDRLDNDPKNLPIITTAMLVAKEPRLVGRLRALLGPPILPTNGMRVLGITITKYELEKTYGTLAAEYHNENDVKVVETALKKSLIDVARILGLVLRNIKIETEGTDGGAAQGNQPGGPPGAPGGGPPGRGGVPSGSAPGGSGPPSTNPQDEGPVSKLKLSRKGRYIIIEAELNTVQRAHDVIYALTAATVTKMRGRVEMASPAPAWDKLSKAGIKFYEGGNIPPATYRRAEGTGGRLARDWPPHQRVSWMAGLLPFLGHDDVFQQINTEKTWRDDGNLKAGSIVIPAFLDPRYPKASREAKLASLGSRTQAATHYVGVAGVGLDIADFVPDRERDPKRRAELEKRMGAFGYDRQTAVKDVTDGLSNSIYMIQVPPTHQRPWIAGGGATTMAVPEKNSIKPFVNRHPDGRGAYVLMLDGSVRFIKEDISDEVFKALCTIRGGEKIDDLEAIAPKPRPKASMTTEDKSEDKEKSEDKDKSDEKPDN